MRRGEGQAWSDLGIVLSQLGRFDEARASGQQAVAAFVAAGDTHNAGIAGDWLNTLPE